jgi:hypothetical protein
MREKHEGLSGEQGKGGWNETLATAVASIAAIAKHPIASIAAIAANTAPRKGSALDSLGGPVTQRRREHPASIAAREKHFIAARDCDRREHPVPCAPVLRAFAWIHAIVASTDAHPFSQTPGRAATGEIIGNYHMLNARERNHYAHKFEAAALALRECQPCIEHMISQCKNITMHPKPTTLNTQITSMKNNLLKLRNEVLYAEDLLETIEDE